MNLLYLFIDCILDSIIFSFSFAKLYRVHLSHYVYFKRHCVLTDGKMNKFVPYV